MSDQEQVDDQRKQYYHFDIYRQRVNYVYTAMIGLALIVVQAFISAGLSDDASFISVLAFAIAIPIMAMCLFITNEPSLIEINLGESNARFRFIVRLALFVCSLFIFVGLVAAFWHLSRFLGWAILGGGVIAAIMLVYALFRTS